MTQLLKVGVVLLFYYIKADQLNWCNIQGYVFQHISNLLGLVTVAGLQR